MAVCITMSSELFSGPVVLPYFDLYSCCKHVSETFHAHNTHLDHSQDGSN